MDIAGLQQRLRAFAAERGWEPFHTPKNLATALFVEAAELAEIFQWKTPEQSEDVAGDAIERERVGDEAADVLLYLAQLADATKVDLDAAVERKLAKNATRHPPLASVSPGAPAAARRGPERKVHVLVDWENVQPKEEDVRALVEGATDLWLFHGPTQRGVADQHAGFGARATPVRISRTGKNALDFHLAFYMGYIAARHPDARFVVLSNDNGYKPMLEHAKELGFDTVALGFKRVRRTAAKKAATTPRKAAKTAKTARTETAATTAKKAAKAVAAPAAKKAAAKKAARKTPSGTLEAAAPEAASLPAKAPATRAPRAAAPAKTSSRKAATKKAAAVQAPAAAPAASGAAPDVGSLAGRIAEQLHAMTETQRPSRRARLLGMIGNRLPAGTDEAARLPVLERLVAIGALSVDANGAVHYPDGLT